MGRVKRPREDATSTENRGGCDAIRVSTLSAARLLWLEAPSATALAEVESFFKERMSKLKAQREKTSGSSVLSAEEKDVRNRLIMLLLQSGRAEQCERGLRQLGCRARLASCVLDYEGPNPRHIATQHDTAYSAPCIITDNAIGSKTLAALRAALGPITANYWTHHNYSVEPPTPYISYVVPLDAVRAPASSGFGALGALIQSVLARGVERFGADRMSTVRYAELWAHNRPHASGHQLHYDSDDEGRGGIRHPVVSSVLFLQGDVGGPTLMTNQRLGDQRLGTKGWLCFPKENRLLVFDGSVLHGVIPGKGVSPRPGARRVTVMVALWAAINVRDEAGHGSARPFPLPGPGQPKWACELTEPCVELPCTAEGIHVDPSSLPQLWEDVQGRPWPADAPICPYDAVYQGF